jgi:hypothetical protein
MSTLAEQNAGKHEKLLTIRPDGSVIALYDDDLPDLGKRTVFRASAVEPTAEGHVWLVMLSDSDVNGDLAGKFVGAASTRSGALELERRFIEKNILGGKHAD